MLVSYQWRAFNFNTMPELDFKLPADVAAKYAVINTTFPILHSRIGDLDFRIITLEQAHSLVKAGTSYLIEKTAETKPAKETPPKG